ncbi:MAG TPA: 7-carboxy-7-deazaguanine synthase QueE [Xanthomonadales bacterium]|nr:7-carboxy-7-deazaguanine synthase QueE [Xanthomonadales bacterium]
MSSTSTDAREMGSDPRLRITEIFLSLQGEARDSGRLTTFVRLTGCPLRCGYCDTAYAFHGGEWRTIDEIVAQVRALGARHVCVTGGEPLAQKRCIELLKRLCDEGLSVSLETSGALDVSSVDPRVSRVVDVKTPGSGEERRNRWSNLLLLNSHDQLKFVLCGRADYEWARAKLAEHDMAARCDVIFSPSWGQVDPTELANWMIEDRLPARLQLQLHKLLWNDARGK